MTTDHDLIAALRKCEHCGGKGYTGTKNVAPAAWACPHCRLARMAADRIETRNAQLVKLIAAVKEAIGS